MLKLGLGIDIGEAGLGGFDIGYGLREPCAVVPIVDPEQDVARRTVWLSSTSTAVT